MNARDSQQSACHSQGPGAPSGAPGHQMWPAGRAAHGEPVSGPPSRPSVATAPPMVGGCLVGGGAEVAVTVTDQPSVGHIDAPPDEKDTPDCGNPTTKNGRETSRQRNARWKKQWTLDRSRGIRRYVDPTPAVTRINTLLDAGMSYTAIGAACGIHLETIRRIHVGDRTHIQRRTADAILTVNLNKATAASITRPGIGTLRRIQALLTIGWPHDTISAYGLNSRQVIGTKPSRIHHTTHDATCAAYEALRDTEGPSGRARATAHRMGYAPPTAWGDDTIDDPDATPRTGKQETWVDLDDIELLARADHTAEQAAERLGISKNALLRRLSPARRDRPDLIARFAHNADRT